MSTYTRRLQTVLTEEQFQALTQLSIQLGRPISVLIRDAVESIYFEHTRRDLRMAAAQRLIAMSAPVSDWPQMEEEIIEGTQR